MLIVKVIREQDVDINHFFERLEKNDESLAHPVHHDSADCYTIDFQMDCSSRPTRNQLLNFPYQKNVVLPWFESAHLEYKRSLCEAGRDAYLKTLCAMLNLEDEGVIIFGVEDDGVVQGFVANRRQGNTIDHLKLMVDSMCYKQLVYRDGVSISEKDVTVYEKKISKTEYIVLIICRRSRPDCGVVIAASGEEYYRGNASTLLRDRGVRWIEKSMIQHMIKQEREKLLQEIELSNARVLKQQKQHYMALLDEKDRSHIIDIDRTSQIIYDSYKVQQTTSHRIMSNQMRLMYSLLLVLIFIQSTYILVLSL